MTKLKTTITVILAATTFLGSAMLAAADDMKTYEVTLDGTRFKPDELKVKSGEAFRIKVTNNNKAPAEFESSELGFEKLVPGTFDIVVNVRAQEPGKYKFFDDFRQDKSFGYVVAE